MIPTSAFQTGIPSSVSVVDFLYAFLFLVPGFLTYKAAVATSENDTAHGDFEKVAWSLAGSGASLTVYYLLVALTLRIVRPGSVITSPTEWELSQLAVGYPLLLVVATALGVAAGKAYDLAVSSRSGQVRGDAWQFFGAAVHRRSEREGVVLRVVTQDGTYEGYSAFRGWPHRDVLIASPKYGEKDGERVELREYTFVYVPEAQIRAIETDAQIVPPRRALVVAEIHERSASPRGADLNGEYVVFENTGESPLTLSGWTVTDASGERYRFPDAFELPPGARVTLHTGEGEDTATDLYWGSPSPVWNDGDTVTVIDATGALEAQKSY